MSCIQYGIDCFFFARLIIKIGQPGCPHKDQATTHRTTVTALKTFHKATGLKKDDAHFGRNLQALSSLRISLKKLQHYYTCWLSHLLAAVTAGCCKQDKLEEDRPVLFDFFDQVHLTSVPVVEVRDSVKLT